jgi:hypothetical protein
LLRGTGRRMEMDEIKILRTVAGYTNRNDIRNYTDQFISFFRQHDSISFDHVLNDEYKL